MRRLVALSNLCYCHPSLWLLLWLLSAGLQLPDGMPVLYEAAGGIVEPEKMIQAHVLRAWYHGAHVKTGEAVR
jgi:hypothetical protein